MASSSDPGARSGRGVEVETVPDARRRWTPTVYLAAGGGFLLVLQAWTWGGWLIAGPESITEFRDPSSWSYTLIRILEVAIIVVWVLVVVHVTRKCLRERALVFDAKLVIAGYSVIWLDMWTNVLAPLFLYSSNWVNLNNPLTGLPFIPNPEPEALAFPILFHAFNYPVALFIAGVLVSNIMRLLRRRWPRLTNAQLIAICAVCGIAFDFAYEIPMFLSRVWAFPGSPDELALFSAESTKFPIWEWIPAGIAFAAFGALRFFKDDQGRERTERGLERFSSKRRTVLSTLALVAVVNLVWLGATSVQAIGGIYADPWKPLPAHLVNEVCDAPLLGGGERTGTSYGPCPEQGVPLPLRRLPQESSP